MADLPTGPLRSATAWVKGDSQAANSAKPPARSESKPETPPSGEDAPETSKNPFEWVWEAIQGDFNDNRSTSQILVDAAISMIPLVDQLCDIRDLIANCRKINANPKDAWAWVALVLTLIGLFPSLGSLVKGVLKIFFAFVRRSGGKQTAQAVESAMSTVIAFLRRRDVQKYLKSLKVDNVFKWLAEGAKQVKGKINKQALIAAFDRGIAALEELAASVKYVPAMGGKAKEALELVKKVRLMADKHLGEALQPIDDIMSHIVTRLERETAQKQGGVVNAANVHYRGALPEAAAIPLMKRLKPSWLSPAPPPKFPQLDVAKNRAMVDARSAKTRTVKRNGQKITENRSPDKIWPPLTDSNIQSFATLAAVTIKGPAKLYRILAPNSKGMSDCWVSEEVFKRLQSAPDPRAAWRKHLAVWPDWNGNGQFVVYDLKAGEDLNVWRGIASSQTKKDLPGQQLEGGYEQIVFKVSDAAKHDEVLFYRLNSKGQPTKPPLSQSQVNTAIAGMTDDQKAAYFAAHLMLRAEIKHPNIRGPFETGWGYMDFDGRGLPGKIGLPTLPGQSTRP